MKPKIIILLIVIASIAKQSYGQSDSTKQGKKSCENFYAPWHRTINDTSKWNVSKFGHYLSVGEGVGNVNGLAGGSLMLSYSLAYKSHLFTLTHNEASHYVRPPSTAEHYLTEYNGLLFGESLRFKYGIISLSAGIASSTVNYIYASNSPWNYTFFEQWGISFPIELKALLLARNAVGIGIYVSENIVTTPKYSSFSFGGYLVFGYWNKHKK